MSKLLTLKTLHKTRSFSYSILIKNFIIIGKSPHVERVIDIQEGDKFE